MIQIVILSTLFIVSNGIINGMECKWNEHPYLVKVLSRDSVDSSPLLCSGSLISPRLIITASDCVVDSGKRLSEILISIPRVGKVPMRKRATIIDTNGTIAYLRLTHPINVVDLCPSGVSSRRLSHLSIVPSLTSSSIKSFEWDKIDSTTCRFIGFKSTQNVSDFLSNNEVQTASLKVEVNEDSLIGRRESTNLPSPCYEDAGAPFECLVGEEYIQIGIFTYLLTAEESNRDKRDNEKSSNTTTEITINNSTTETPVTGSTIVIPKEAKDSFSRCLTASSLQFARFDFTSIASIIETYDFSSFIKTREMCHYPTN